MYTVALRYVAGSRIARDIARGYRFNQSSIALARSSTASQMRTASPT